MNFRHIKLVCRKELLDYSRDKGAVRKLIALLAILFLSPICIPLIFGSQGSISETSAFQNSSVFILMLLCILVCTNVGIDMTAGEAERKSLEVTFSAPIAGKDIVLGKCLSLILVSLGVLGAFFLSNLVAITLSPYILERLGRPLFVTYSSQRDSFHYFTNLIVAFYLSCFFASSTIAIGFLAKSVREAMSSCSILILLLILPSLIISTFSVRISCLTALVPLLNCQLILSVPKPHIMDWVFSLEILISGTIWPALAAYSVSRVIPEKRI